MRNELRTTMLQEKLSSVSILLVESDELLSSSFQDIINDFIFEKS